MSETNVPAKDERLPIKYPTPFFQTKHPFIPLDTSTNTKNMLMYSSGAGLLFAAVEHSMSKENRGIFGAFTKSGSKMLAFISACTVYEFSYSSLNNLREKNDALNEFIAGNISGAVLGAFKKSLSASVGLGLAFGTLGALLHWTGGLMKVSDVNLTEARGDGIDHNMMSGGVEEGKKQGLFEAVRRAPLSQTREALGEIGRLQK